LLLFNAKPVNLNLSLTKLTTLIVFVELSENLALGYVRGFLSTQVNDPPFPLSQHDRSLLNGNGCGNQQIAT
jgi:hypothetical protein